MKELGMALLGAFCIIGFFAFVIYPDLEYTGGKSVSSCTGECYEEYVRYRLLSLSTEAVGIEERDV